MFNYYTYLACFLVGLVVTGVLTPWVSRLALFCGAVDVPANRKIHKSVIPLFGGIGIFAGMWVPLGALCFYDNLVARRVQEGAMALVLIMLSGLIMLLVGVADDLRGLNARWKFLAQFPTAIGLVLAGVRFDGISIPYVQHVSLGTLGPIISVLWLVGITNALNLIDGIDGLAGGVAMLISGTLGILAVAEGNALLAVIMFSMAGACLGFVRHNFSPASIFLGDSGSLFLGMTLAVSATMSSVKARVGTSLLAPVVLLGYPIADTLLAMVRRYLRGKPMFSGDASHIHHRLLYKGLDHRKACGVIYTVCLGFCLWTIAIAREHLPAMYIGFTLFLLLSLAGINYLGYLNFLNPQNASRNHFKVAHYFSEMIKAKMAFARTSDDVVVLVAQAAKEFEQVSMHLRLPAAQQRPGLDLHWPDPAAARRAMDRKLPPLVQDRYQFEDTGFEVEACYEPSHAADDLWIEKRTLFEQICESANNRLLEIAKASGGPSPESSRSVPQQSSDPSGQMRKIPLQG